MAVSGKTAAPWEQPYFLGTDKPPDMAAVTKAGADKTHANLATVAAAVLGSSQLKPTAGIKAASADLTLTGSYQDVALSGGNLVITPTVASTLLVIAIFDLRITLGTGAGKEGVAFGTIRLDSTDQTPIAKNELDLVALESVVTNTGSAATVSQVYALALTAAEHTIKMRAMFSRGASAKVEADNTRMLYALFAS